MNRLLLGGIGLLALSLTAEAEDGAKVPTVRTSAHHFKIPFQIPTEDRDRYQSLELWHSTDEGAHWERIAKVTPDQGQFNVRDFATGTHWLAVRTYDKKGRPSPGDDADIVPNMKVVVVDEPKQATPPEPPPVAEVSRTQEATIDYRVAACLARARISACRVGSTGILR